MRLSRRVTLVDERRMNVNRQAWKVADSRGSIRSFGD